MRQLEKRITALERRTHDRRHALQKALEDALASFSWRQSDIELLLSACAAEADGRALTDAEVSARATYQECLKQKCRCARIPYPIELDHTRYVH